jgi:hypothetical protein
MSLNLIKRLDVPARVAHVLLREQLIYGLEFAHIYSLSSGGSPDASPRLMASGVNGTCDSTQPQTFTVSAATFNSSMVGKYLVLYDTSDANAGIHKIIGVPNTETLIVQGGLYGSNFTTDVSIAYRIIDPTTNTGSTEFTVSGITGTNPIWQARFFINATDSNKTIRVEVGPNGGFIGGNRTSTGDTIGGTSPNMILTDATATFNATDVGRYITITGATTPANNGVFLINSYTSPTLIGYTNASGVAEAFALGTWSISGNWTSTAITNRFISADPAADRWYFKLTDANIIGWTENVAGNGVYNVAYVGAGSTRRPTADIDFAIAAGGTSPAFLSTIAAIGAVTPIQVNYQAIVYGDAAINNMFTSLPASNFDLRNDSADIPVGCEVVGNIEDDRGILHGLQWISDQIPYRSFVDNGRHLLSLGSGLAVEWDGSLAR